MIVAIVVSSCAREKDRFWPDTINSQLQLTDCIVKKGDPDIILKTIFVDHGGERAATRRLTRRLPVGLETVVSVSVPTHGEYREGGGWIFKGCNRVPGVPIGS